MATTLSKYTDKWHVMYQKEAEIIKNVLKDNVIEIHHIGSTSIVNLIAKPQIDVVASVHNLDEVINPLESLGYVYKGEFNIPFRYFFGKNQGTLKVNLHIVNDKDPEMTGFLMFRNYMRSHPEAVKEYIDLKLSISDKLSSIEKYPYFNGYTLSKDEFIRKILKKAGFHGLCMRFVIHYNEQNYEKTICKLHNYIVQTQDKRYVFSIFCSQIHYCCC